MVVWIFGVDFDWSFGFVNFFVDVYLVLFIDENEDLDLGLDFKYICGNFGFVFICSRIYKYFIEIRDFKYIKRCSFSCIYL